MDSILTSIKKLLGISEEYTHFDQDIIMHINTAFMVLNQLGVGPEKCFRITSDAEIWDDFLLDKLDYESVKSCIYLRVKLLFDPPLSSAVMESTKAMIAEFEWRLRLAAESTI